MIDFRNLNTLWASVIVETLCRCGVTTAIVCPGSRSTPLTLAFANHQEIEAIPILDERSASFFALGKAKKTGIPTVLICTSGTAGANFYPAIIEAKKSGVPLIVITADRPPELRNCHAGQTIDQIKLYGHFPNWQCELAVPEATLPMLRYLRQTIIHAWQQSLDPVAGVVHLNQPLRKPLAPIEQSMSEIQATFPPDFFDAVSPILSPRLSNSLPWNSWQNRSGIIIAGLAQPQNPETYCRAIAFLAKKLSFPVLAEALSPLRNYNELNPYLISTYDSILRHPTASALTPDLVIQIGELPTSKELRNWLQDREVPRWAIDARIDNLDPLHGKTIHLQTSIEAIEIELEIDISPSPYCQQWLRLESQTRAKIDRTLTSLPESKLYEGKAAWLLSQYLPVGTSIFLANSMSVRNAEYFWQPNQRYLIPFFNRGANGIDGTLSTALGIAYRDSGVLLTGDLALLHDTNGFLIGNKFQGHLTIVLINNNGGGIFEILPIANFPNFEEYFATPQTVNISNLCSAYGIEHINVKSWQQFIDLVSCLPTKGIRVLELICDRHLDAAWLKNNLSLFTSSS